MSYASWSVVFGEQPSAAKWNILGTNDSAFNDGSGYAAGALGSINASLAAGIACQFVYNNAINAATGTTVTPTDGTIPQNTEGDQYMSQAITPKAATNLLLIEADLFISFSVASKDIVIALFQDATANALAANMVFMPATATTPATLTLRYVMVAGTTSSTTFKIRVGAESAGTTSFNAAIAVSPMFGSVIPKSNMRITEFKAS
jgi:hypothetical protein